MFSRRALSPGGTVVLPPQACILYTDTPLHIYVCVLDCFKKGMAWVKLLWHVGLVYIAVTGTRWSTLGRDDMAQNLATRQCAVTLGMVSQQPSASRLQRAGAQQCGSCQEGVWLKNSLLFFARAGTGAT